MDGRRRIEASMRVLVARRLAKGDTDGVTGETARLQCVFVKGATGAITKKLKQEINVDRRSSSIFGIPITKAHVRCRSVSACNGSESGL